MGMGRRASALNYYRAETGERDPEVMLESVVLASSRDLGWDGVVAEVGRSRAFEPTDVATSGHHLALNLDDRPLLMETRGRRDFRRVTLPPNTFWISPAGAPFTLRTLGPSRWGAVELALPKVRRVLGRNLSLPPMFGLFDAPLAEVVRAVLREAKRSGESGPLYADGLCTAIVGRLASLFDPKDETIDSAGGLSERQLHLVQEAVEHRIAERLTVDELARVARLSTAHFARAFKERTHETPHAFVMRRRVERACELLLAGQSVAQTAAGCGFHDQPHLSRALKRSVGVTPAAFAAARRR
ncbi:MAG: AraC family transcriptional regulator [Myxococcales bacterium]|nr:AraC family transcriptional regulator [Myxococcales bacterium]